MKEFYKILEQDAGYQQLLGGLKQKKSPLLASGLADIHKGHVIYSVVSARDTPALVLVASDSIGIRLCEDLNTMLGYQGAFLYPAREFVFREVEGVSLEYEHIRLGILGRMLEDSCKIVVATIEGAFQYTLPPTAYIAHTKELKGGSEYLLDDLLAFLLAAGYQRVEQVEGVCQFAVRGGILDIMPPSVSEPYRIEFWGDEIDTIATFDIASQRRLDLVQSLMITPAREALISAPQQFTKTLEAMSKKQKGSAGLRNKELTKKDIEKIEQGFSLTSADKYLPLLYEEPASLLDYCGDRLLFVCEPTSLKEACKNALWQQEEDVKILLEEGVLFGGTSLFSLPGHTLEQIITTTPSIIMDTFNRSLPGISLGGLAEIKAMQLSLWGGDYTLLVEDIAEYMLRGYGVAVLAGTDKAAAALTSDLVRDGFTAHAAQDIAQITPKSIAVLPGSLSAGMEYPNLRFALLTQSRNVGTEAKPRRRHKDGKKLRSISDLTVGDYVVHVSHGIGEFLGIVKREIQGVTKDYIKIRYGGTDMLFVPVTQLDLVSKYIGAAEGVQVRLNRLNSLEWQKTRSKVKGAVKEMAKELTVLYAKRQNTKGHAFSTDGNWQQEFEARFPYEETEDQLRCVREIKSDMEQSMPMDRLLCGDVGFGKTEVALRAIFKCVMDSMQVAVLVPTTILAWQHYQTFLQRLEGYPIKIELLSRFRTPKEQKEIIKQLKRGEIDVVIGTHRVVQKDVEFKELGLCIIDEEQRFGVAHKEKFKELRASVDILTLSATPIPRTLNMAMSGIRDMSLIEEAPRDRYPVQTYVLEAEEGVITQAIERELRRNGQVFYLHNRIDTIHHCAQRLQKQIPSARIAVAHGRMGEATMSEIWRRFMVQEIDILVCTTIIETGVDVPNANTLIIENADRYGLSQLYQLRGRVGRSTRRAYAYFTFRRGMALSEVATKRLAAIREFTTFGSGFRIAMRDLEIRGAGNILGAQQHGHMAAVGYDMYLRLLAEAVQEETGEVKTPTTDSIIDIQVDAHIPEEYISNLSQRIDIYKKIAAIQTEEDAYDITDELIDRFGDPPEAVQGLLEVALVRGTASRLGIAEIVQNEQRILLYPETLDIQLAGAVAGALQGRILVNAGTKPYFSVRLLKGQSPTTALKETLGIMAEQQGYLQGHLQAHLQGDLQEQP